MDDALKPYLLKMLVSMLKETDLENKRLAMTTLYSAARNKPSLILSNLSKLLPYVIKASEVNLEFVREVQMGPFKHKVDDGLEMRKGAYETLHAFIDMAYSRMNHIELFDRVIAGFQDEHDIRMLSLMMLTKLIYLDRDETGRRLDAIAERFQAILSTKLKENSVKQEVEKHKEAVKEVLRVTIRLRDHFPENSGFAGSNMQGQAWKAYLEYIKKDFSNELTGAETQIKSQN
jgi:cullin-associated NEDD8-dissociated protein 1